jgi:hypothetical protein
MKIVWTILLALGVTVGGLFLFQNSTRMLSVDEQGLQLSLDLFFVGVGTSNISLITLLLVTASIGFIVGLLAPIIWKSYRTL